MRIEILDLTRKEVIKDVDHNFGLCDHMGEFNKARVPCTEEEYLELKARLKEYFPKKSSYFGIWPWTKEGHGERIKFLEQWKAELLSPEDKVQVNGVEYVIGSDYSKPKVKGHDEEM